MVLHGMVLSGIALYCNVLCGIALAVRSMVDRFPASLESGLVKLTPIAENLPIKMHTICMTSHDTARYCIVSLVLNSFACHCMLSYGTLHGMVLLGIA